MYVAGLDTIPIESVADGELFAGTEHYTMYYYRLQDSHLHTLGHENPTTLLQYDTPLLSMVYPVANAPRTI
jgi:hypothetical protein